MKHVAALLLLFCINNANAQTTYEIIEKYENDSVLVIIREDKCPTYSKGILVKDIKQGDFHYYLNDAIVGTMKYANDTMVAMTKYDKSGNKLSYEEYKNDKLNGVSITYYAGNKIKTEGAFQNNLRHGNWKLYDENGNLLSETIYENNIGYCKTYDGNNNLTGEGNIYATLEYGVWTYYNKRGKVDSYMDYDTLENAIAFYKGE